MIPATPLLPPTQFQISPLNANSFPMLNTLPSTSQRMVSFNVTLNTRLLNERQPTIRPHDESEQIVKHMAVEVDRSVQLCGKIYELKDISKHHLQHKKD